METLNKIVKKYLDAQKTGNTKVLATLYQEMVIARNEIAFSKGYTDYVDLQINSFFHVPTSDWKIYTQNKDSFASKFSPKLENSLNIPHFLSKLPELEVKFPEQVFDLFAKNFPEILEVKSKISIEESENTAHFQHSKEDDHYTIFIPKTNLNQKVSMLIHELAHVLSQEISKNREHIYSMELESHKTEFKVAKNISKEFFNAVVGEYLICLARTDFQTSMFKNPDQDPISIYSKTFEKHIGSLTAEDQTAFLYDKKITHLPLVDLPDAVSIVNISLAAA